MSVERLDPAQLAGLDEQSVRAFIESDFKIRSGLCPNDHGLMRETEYIQHCVVCGFSTNKLPERGVPS